MPLTDAQCRNATCPPDRRQARFSDSGGLYLQVSPAGSRRWFWKYRIAGVEKQLALGSYPGVALSGARKARDAAKLQKENGLDPVQTRKVASLLDTLLQYNRTALGGGMTIHREPTDLAQACASEVELLKAAHPESEINLDVEGDCSGDFDASAVREALGNLVNNAVSYGDDGRILLSLVGNRGTVSLKVFNTGPQIPMTEIPALFNALQRGEDIHPDENQTSLGLGLFIVQQIATAHGGEVRCASSSKGTTFEILLPRRGGASKKN